VLAAFRRLHGLSGPLALGLLIAIVLGLPGLAHDGFGDDPLCEIPLRSDGAAAASIDAETRDAYAHGDHCYLCHWSRSIRAHPSAAAKVHLDDLQPSMAVPAGDVGSTRFESFRLPGRSPPA
jgi:hypothetical protein